MSDKPVFETITPALIELTQPERPGQPLPPGQKKPLKLVVALAGFTLLVLAIGVFFVLPDLVGNRLPVPAPVATTPSPGPAADSPYQQARLAEARREAQDILASFMEARKTLEAKQVTLWGAKDFATALDMAAAGDELYRQGAFDKALAQYRQALDKASGLVEQTKTLVTGKLGEGTRAIADGSQGRAENAFRLVLAIDPGNSEATRGLERTALMPKTLPLLKSARQAIAGQDWPGAQKDLKALLALDKDHEEARHLLGQAGQAIQSQAFNNAMGAGLAAMQAGDHQSAAGHFERALGLDPGSSDARASLDQARNALLSRTLAATLASAEAQESREQWAEAAASYQQVLDSDDTVVAARVGLLRSQARAKLDGDIETLLADPLRLASGPVFTHGGQLLRDARQISPPGPRLQRQIAALAQVLEKARLPVTVELTSDNKTSVTLLRVGEMGAFTSRKVELRPGRYVALGIRPGYRDVRVTFDVTADIGPTVEIVCRDPV